MPIEKITNMGEHRKEKVEELVEQAQEKGWTPEFLSGQLKRLANTPTKRDKRNWKVVARTELTDANALQSLDAIIEKYGRRAQVKRITGDACNECLHAFGVPQKPRIWAAGMVPDHLRGSVHTSCRCSPWMLAGRGLQKSVVDDANRSHGLAMVHNGLLHLPHDSHQAANDKQILYTIHDHLKSCTEEDCPICKKHYEVMKQREGRGINKAFKLPAFIHSMRFVIHHILKPKKVRGLPEQVKKRRIKMPAFIKTPDQEARWKRAKNAVKRSRKKEQDQFTDQDWGLVTKIYKEIKKSGGRDAAYDWIAKAKSYDAKELKMGEKVEAEHGGNKQERQNVAKDHLDEFKWYYTFLKAMEGLMDFLKKKGVGTPNRKHQF